MLNRRDLLVKDPPLPQSLLYITLSVWLLQTMKKGSWFHAGKKSQRNGALVFALSVSPYPLPTFEPDLSELLQSQRCKNIMNTAGVALVRERQVWCRSRPTVWAGILSWVCGRTWSCSVVWRGESALGSSVIWKQVIFMINNQESFATRPLPGQSASWYILIFLLVKGLL